MMAEPDTLDDVPLETIVNASPFTFSLNREGIIARLVKAEAALALCVDALEQVEWIEDVTAAIWDYCPWCREYYDWTLADTPKHADDCAREVALAAAKGDPSHN